MKKRSIGLIIMAVVMSGALFSCSIFDTGSLSASSGSITDDEKDSASAATISSVSEPTITGDFALTTDDGTYSQSGSVYTITSAGTYVASGSLSDGQIVVEAGEDDEVELQLNGASIVCSKDAPILANSADKLKVKAVKGTENLIKDTRATKTTDTDAGEGAISAHCDLTLNGQGTLVVTGNYNNGVHTTKDLTLKNQTLQVTAPNNALKGKDSVTFEEGGSFKIVSTVGDGVKTESTDVSSKDNQKGTVSISGDVAIDITSKEDGIDSAYDVTVFTSEEGTPSVNVTSGTSSSKSSSSSMKGIKAENIIDISGGVLSLTCIDDAIHCNYGTSFDNGSSGEGIINISGGTLSLSSGDDGIHADNTINITGGTIDVTKAVEGLEANFINIGGGYTTIYATDDGVNCSKKINKTPVITITGGHLDVTVASGDCDGIDSNGNYIQTGGTVVTRAPGLSGNENAGAIDADGTIKITGGTLFIVGAYSSISSSVSSKTWGSTSGSGGGTPGGGGHGGGPGRVADANSDSYSFSSGTYTLNLEHSTEFELAGTATMFTLYTNDTVSGTTYNISRGSTEVLTFSF